MGVGETRGKANERDSQPATHTLTQTEPHLNETGPRVVELAFIDPPSPRGARFSSASFVVTDPTKSGEDRVIRFWRGARFSSESFVVTDPIMSGDRTIRALLEALRPRNGPSSSSSGSTLALIDMNWKRFDVALRFVNVGRGPPRSVFVLGSLPEAEPPNLALFDTPWGPLRGDKCGTA